MGREIKQGYESIFSGRTGFQSGLYIYEHVALSFNHLGISEVFMRMQCLAALDTEHSRQKHCAASHTCMEFQVLAHSTVNPFLLLSS